MVSYNCCSHSHARQLRQKEAGEGQESEAASGEKGDSYCGLISSTATASRPTAAAATAAATASRSRSDGDTSSLRPRTEG